MAAPHKRWLLTLTGTTALVAAWNPALAACVSNGGDSYQCSGTGQTIGLYTPPGANIGVDAGTTATSDGTNPLFTFAGDGTLNVGAGAQLNGTGQSVVATGPDNQSQVQVTNAGTLQGTDTIHTWGALRLTNQAGGTISGTNTAVIFNHLSQVTNNGTIQGNILGNQGEVNNAGTVTGDIDLIYGMIVNSGTINGAARGWANNIIANSGTITGEVRVDGNGAWDLGIANDGRMESSVRATGKGTLTNGGTIVGPVTTQGAVNLDNTGFITGAVDMEANGAGGATPQQTITNRGTLQSTLTARGTTTLNNQLIIAGAVALEAGGQYTVTNSGRMENGLRMSDSGTLDNSGLIAKGVAFDNYDKSYTATNSGTITDGIRSNGRITLTNAAGGTISGANAVTFNHLSQITNNGTIQGNILGNEGEVTNNGTLTGNIDLIYGTITNTGTINGAVNGWANNVITNSGTVTGAVRADGNGAWDLALTNSGRMESSVQATGKGTVTNSGTIVGPLTAQGAITLDNSGVILGAVSMEVNGFGGATRQQTFINRGALLSTLYAFGNTTLDNRGTIAGMVLLENVGTYAITNSGTLAGGLLSYGGAVTLDNSGTILGPVALSNADDIVTMRDGAVFSGLVSGAGGTDTLRFLGGGGSQNLSSFTGFERVEMGSGTWYLSGATPALLSVNGGTARGSALFGGIAVAAGGTLAPGINGTGSMIAIGDVTLAPGSVLLVEINGLANSMLHVTGTATLGGTLSVSALGNLQRGQYVLMDAGALSGWFDTIVLPNAPWRQTVSQNGGQVVLTVTMPALATSTSGTTAGVSGTLENLRNTATGDLQQVIDKVSLLPAPQQERALASMTPERQASTPTVMSQQVSFFQGTVQNRVAQLGGSPRTNGAAPIQLAMAGTTLEGLDGTTLYAGQSRWNDESATGLWLAPWGGVARQKESGDASGWSASSGGIAVGVDTELAPEITGGVAFGWGRTETRFGGAGGNGDTDNFVASLYGAWSPRPWIVDASLTGALSRFDSTRIVEAGSETRHARADYAGRTVVAALGAKRRFAVEGLELSPDARLTATRWWLDGYEESGAGSMNLRVDGRSGNRLRAETGVELAHSFEVESGRLRPWLRLAAGNDWTSGNRAMQARFSGTATGFAVAGQDDDGLRWLPGAGLSLDLDQSLELSLEYQGELRPDFSSHTGQMAVRYKF